MWTGTVIRMPGAEIRCGVGISPSRVRVADPDARQGLQRRLRWDLSDRALIRNNFEELGRFTTSHDAAA